MISLMNVLVGSLYLVLGWIVLSLIGYLVYFLTGLEYFAYPLTWTLIFIFHAINRGN